MFALTSIVIAKPRISAGLKSIAQHAVKNVSRHLSAATFPPLSLLYDIFVHA
jgi:hypothetical protein